VVVASCGKGRGNALVERTINEEQRNDNSSASNQHLPAAWDGARKIK